MSEFLYIRGPVGLSRCSAQSAKVGSKAEFFPTGCENMNPLLVSSKLLESTARLFLCRTLTFTPASKAYSMLLAWSVPDLSHQPEKLETECVCYITAHLRIIPEALFYFCGAQCHPWR